jgi:hypothetical protein
MHDRCFAFRLLWTLALAAPLALSGCSSSDDEPGSSAPLTFLAEIEPNDDATQARALTSNRPAGGDVAVAGDQDWWSIQLTAGDIVQVEMFATRLDHATWDAAANTAQLKLFGPDGTTELMGHYPGGSSGGPTWYWGQHDHDIPMFRAPATGTYYIRVGGADVLELGGDYAIVVSDVSIAGLQLETEAVAVTGENDVHTDAEAITPGTVYGFHVDDEADYYSFTLAEATFVDLELVSFRNGVWQADNEYYDPMIVLYDTDGTTSLAQNDDTYFYDSGIEFWLTTPGTYFVSVDECCGAGDAPYFLHLRTRAVGTPTPEAEGNNFFASAQPTDFGDLVDAQTIDGDDDFYSVAALAGDTLFVKLFDVQNRSDALEQVNVELLGPDGTTPIDFTYASGWRLARALIPADGTYHVLCSNSAVGLTNYAVEIELYRRSAFEAEPNDEAGDSSAFNLSNFAAGAIGASGDEDWYSFSAQANRLVTISCVADSDAHAASNGFWSFATWGSDLAPKLEIFDTDGIALLATSVSATRTYASTEGVVDGLPVLSVSFVAPAAGAYFVRVTSDDNTFGPEMLYSLRKR